MSSEKMKFPYFLVTVDSMSRFPVAFGLKSVTAHSVGDCLLNVSSWFGIPSTNSCDDASHNVSALTQEVMKDVAVVPGL